MRTNACDYCHKLERGMVKVHWISGTAHYCEQCWTKIATTTNPMWLHGAWVQWHGSDLVRALELSKEED